MNENRLPATVFADGTGSRKMDQHYSGAVMMFFVIDWKDLLWAEVIGLEWHSAIRLLVKAGKDSGGKMIL